MKPTFCIALALALAPAGCRREPKPPTVEIRGHRWFVDVAATEAARYRGLSGRTQLSDDVGMLFIYPDPQVLDFCMRDCLIPIDIAFLDADRRVIAMHTMEVEPDLAGRVGYSSVTPAVYALEVAGGALRRAGVQVGDTAAFEGAIPPPAKAEAGP